MVFTGNSGKVIGNNIDVYQVIVIILFVLPNVENLRK